VKKVYQSGPPANLSTQQAQQCWCKVENLSPTLERD